MEWERRFQTRGGDGERKYKASASRGSQMKRAFYIRPFPPVFAECHSTNVARRGKLPK